MDNIVKPLLGKILLEHFDMNEIGYSHIKPVIELHRELNNCTELCLLIPPEEYNSVFEILTGLGFVQVRNRSKIMSSCNTEFLGLDKDTGEIISVKLCENLYHGIRAFGLATVRPLLVKFNEIFRKIRLVKSRKKILAPAGKIIAFMGGDGSGKTSNIREFENWFGQYFKVRVLHVGKPAKGPIWYGFGVLLKLRKMLLRIRTDNFHESVKYLMVAWYRRRAFQKAVSLRSKGFLVALDRFPLPGMEIMEAPQIRRLTGGGGIYDFMAKLEDQFHRVIRGADEIFVLMLDPAIARIRRPDDRPQELKRRCCEILHRDWPDGYAHLIDASKPFDEVVLKIRRLAWSSLNKTAKVVELVGPAGAGKTSATRKMKESSNSIQTSVSWHDSKLCLMKVMLKRSAKIMSLLFQKVPSGVIKEVVGLEVDLEILLMHKSRHLLPCRDVLLEVGPIFKVSKLKMDGTIQSIKWIDEIYGKIDRALDCLIWIDSSNEILRYRVNLRAKEHEMKNATSEEMFRFFEEYRKCFSEVIDNCNGSFAVNRLDISSMSVEEVAGAIREIAFKSEKFRQQ